MEAQPQVRGIATFLPARSLVLVGDDNQILDVLTVEHQELLESRITWEVANSGLQRREIAKKELKFNLGLEAAVAKSQLPPVKAFWQLMAWVQTSPATTTPQPMAPAPPKTVSAGNAARVTATAATAVSAQENHARKPLGKKHQVM